MVVLLFLGIDLLGMDLSGLDFFRVQEGMDLEAPNLKIKGCNASANIYFPNYDLNRHLFIDNNNFMFHNYQNILQYAQMDCSPENIL